VCQAITGNVEAVGVLEVHLRSLAGLEDAFVDVDRLYLRIVCDAAVGERHAG